MRQLVASYSNIYYWADLLLISPETWRYPVSSMKSRIRASTQYSPAFLLKVPDLNPIPGIKLHMCAKYHLPISYMWCKPLHCNFARDGNFYYFLSHTRSLIAQIDKSNKEYFEMDHWLCHSFDSIKFSWLWKLNYTIAMHKVYHTVYCTEWADASRKLCNWEPEVHFRGFRHCHDNTI